MSLLPDHDIWQPAAEAESCLSEVGEFDPEVGEIRAEVGEFGSEVVEIDPEVVAKSRYILTQDWPDHREQAFKLSVIVPEKFVVPCCSSFLEAILGQSFRRSRGQLV